MDMKLYFEYSIKVSKEEFRLIGLALIDGLKSTDDKMAAADLNKKMLELKKRQIEDQLNLVDSAIARVGDMK